MGGINPMNMNMNDFSNFMMNNPQLYQMMLEKMNMNPSESQQGGF